MHCSPEVRALAWATLPVGAYAALRYGWPPGGLPYLANKVLALLALGCLGLGLAHPLRAVRARSGPLGLSLLLVHLALSAALLSPRLYPKLYVEGVPTPLFGLSLLAGALGAGLFFSIRGRWTPVHERLAQGSLALTALHLGALGVPGWIQPETWPRALPPLSLLAFLYAIGALARHRWRTRVVPDTTGLSPAGESAG